MNNEFDTVLQAKLEEYIGDGPQKKMSAAQLAKAAGISQTYLSNYRAGKLPCNIEDIERKLKEFFQNAEESEKIYKFGEYVETSISRVIYQTIRFCHLQGGLSMVAGDAGIGKTMTALKYLEEYPSAYYIYVNTCTNGVTAFLRSFARELNIAASGRKDDMWFKINDALSGKGRKVLVVDESQHLPIKTIEAIRSFTDCNPNFGVCFIGNHEGILSKDLPGNAQIRNRTKMKINKHLSDITKDDVKMMLPDLDRRSIDFMYKVSQTKDMGLRGMCGIYEAAVNNRDISYDGIRSAAKETTTIMFE